jgi:small-conductance mechanosensitive channel
LRLSWWRWAATAILIAAAAVPRHWVSPPLAPELARVGRAALVLAAGYLLIAGFERRLAKVGWRGDAGRAALLRLLARLALDLLVAAALLGALGVRLSQITIGASVITVFLGLAGSTVFANVLAGAVLVIWRPFDIGDEVSIISWQMPVLAMTRPHETLPSANPVRIRDVNLFHTIAVAEDGQVTIIPNSVMVLAIVRNHSHSSTCRVRLVTEAPREVDPEALLQRMQALRPAVERQNVRLHGDVAARLLDLSPTGTTFVVELWVPSARDREPAQSALVVAVSRALRELAPPAAPR